MRGNGIGGRTAVVGVGCSDFTLKPKMSNEGLAVQAFKRALGGTSLDKSQIDGLVVTSGAPGGVDYDKTAEVLGVNVGFTLQTWAHGRFSNPGLHAAAMAIHCGFATIVACVSVFGWAKRKRTHGNIGGTGDHESFRLGGGPHGENPVYGLAAPLGGAAIAYQRYLAAYGYSGDEAAALALAQRKHALLNPGAIMKTPLTREQYLASPHIIWPLRKLDCSLPSDGAVAVIVTSAERARDLTHTPAYITGISALKAGRNEHSFGAPWLGIFQQEMNVAPDRIDEPFAMAGIERKDIAALQIYDAFLPQTIYTFERFGFCKPGEALSYWQDGRIEIGGEIPLNTAGGHLGEAHCGGWNQIAEAVRQVQGVCGERQIPDAKHTIYAHGAGDCTIFSREVA
jgi:acetyl-CoA acetyltransferase